MTSARGRESYGATMADRTTGKAIMLVVDRDPHVRELEAHFLDKAGFTVVFAQDGIYALEHARRVIPDIVITEILVPGLDGLALCRQLKGDPRTRAISVLIFSILSAADRAHEAGADAYLRKPLADRALIDTVQRLLAERKGAPT